MYYDNNIDDKFNETLLEYLILEISLNNKELFSLTPHENYIHGYVLFMKNHEFDELLKKLYLPPANDFLKHHISYTLYTHWFTIRETARLIYAYAKTKNLEIRYIS